MTDEEYSELLRAAEEESRLDRAAKLRGRWPSTVLGFLLTITAYTAFIIALAWWTHR